MQVTRRGMIALVVLTVLASHAWVTAQVLVTGSARHVRTAPIEVGRRVGQPILNEVGAFSAMPASRGTTIFGIVQQHTGTLVPNAGLVIIRNLLTGQVMARTTVNELAQFSVRGLPPGLYTAELVNTAGDTIASTPAFTAGVGEVIQLAQTIPVTPLQGVARVASSVTTSALSSAASSGVLAVAAPAATSPAK